MHSLTEDKGAGDVWEGNRVRRGEPAQAKQAS